MLRTTPTTAIAVLGLMLSLAGCAAGGVAARPDLDIETCGAETIAALEPGFGTSIDDPYASGLPESAPEPSCVFALSDGTISAFYLPADAATFDAVIAALSSGGVSYTDESASIGTGTLPGQLIEGGSLGGANGGGQIGLTHADPSMSLEDDFILIIWRP